MVEHELQDGERRMRVARQNSSEGTEMRRRIAACRERLRRGRTPRRILGRDGARIVVELTAGACLPHTAPLEARATGAAEESLASP